MISVYWTGFGHLDNRFFKVKRSARAASLPQEYAIRSYISREVVDESWWKRCLIGNGERLIIKVNCRNGRGGGGEKGRSRSSAVSLIRRENSTCRTRAIQVTPAYREGRIGSLAIST